MRVLFLLGLMVCATQASNSILIKLLAKFRIGNCQGDCPCDNSTNGLKAAEAKLTELQNAVNGLSRSLNQATAANSSVENAQSAVDELKSSLTSTTPSSMPRRRFRRGANSVNFTSCEVSNQTLVGSVENVTLIVLDGIITALQTISTSFQVTKLNCYTNITQKLAYGLHDGTYNVPSNAQNLLSKADNASAKATQAKTNINNAITNFKENLAKKKTELESQKGVVLNLGGTVPGTTEASTPVTPNPEMYSDCLSLIQKSIVLRKCPFSSPPSTDTFSKRIFGENCWSTQKSISIISSGNNNASLEEYSYNVGILVGESRESIYGGSVLSSTWILTAAHILHNRSDSMLMTHVYVEHKKVIDVSRYFLHPNFQICPNSFENDIALLELCEPIEYTFPAIKPLCFSTVSEDLASTSAMTTDWVSASEYTEVVLNIISKEKCAEQLMSKGLSTPRNKNTFFCTYTDSEDTCLYKDGGPVVAEVSPGDWIQLGVTSRGYNCSNADTPRVHMDVTAFKDWIVNTTKIRPVYESEMYQECPISTDSPTTPLQNSTNQASSQCPVETLLGDKCWSGDAANQRIIGGQNASRQYPYQVALYLNGRFSCGGSIISSSWIMTAAHCVVDDCGSWSGNQSVRYGSSYHSQGKTAYVKRIIVHQNYTSRNYPTYYDANDIALMELCQPLDFSTPEVQPICLSAKPTQNENTVIATGWGSLRCDDDDLMPEYLQEVTLNVSSNEECQKIFQSYYTGNSEIPLPPDNNTYVCSTNKDEDTGHGDSGGPIVTRLFTGCWVQLGITSYGFDCDRKPGVYTRVSAFKDWICEQTKLC